VRRRPLRNPIDRILAIKQRSRLFQRPVLGLHDKEPQKHELEGEPAHVYDLSVRASESVMGPDRAGEGRT
jgi:hypothetical protein